VGRKKLLAIKGSRRQRRIDRAAAEVNAYDPAGRAADEELGKETRTPEYEAAGNADRAAAEEHTYEAR
jgi:hypothetical protein